MNFPETLVGSCVVLWCALLAPPAQAQVNDPPDVQLPAPPPDTAPSTPVAFTVTVSDPDVGAGLMQMEIDISDPDGAGPLTPASVGRFSWGFGSNITSDVALANLSAVNSGLSSFVFTPAAGYAGLARIVFEIDDQGNTGSGGALSRTRFIDIDVCVPDELGTPACATNAGPDIIRPPNGSTPRGVPIALPSVASDVDVGAGLMQIEIDIADPDGVGALTPASVGSFAWSQGSGVQSDVAELPLGALNSALAGLVFTPNPAYLGLARIVFEVDDRGNSGSGGILSRTRFVDITVQPAPGQLRFAGGCLVTFGEGGVLGVPVERVGGSDGAASVTVGSSDLTAVSGVDYNLSGTTLAWNSGQSGVRTAQVQIVGDAQTELTERFLLVLGGEVGAGLGDPDVQLARIRDIDASILIFGEGFEDGCPP